MKKFILIIILIFIFLIGVSIGNESSTYNKIIDDSKEEFENEILKPNNSYEPIDLKPNEGFINNIANKIDKLIKTISDKLN